MLHNTAGVIAAARRRTTTARRRTPPHRWSAPRRRSPGPRGPTAVARRAAQWCRSVPISHEAEPDPWRPRARAATPDGRATPTMAPRPALPPPRCRTPAMPTPRCPAPAGWRRSITCPADRSRRARREGAAPGRKVTSGGMSVRNGLPPSSASAVDRTRSTPPRTFAMTGSTAWRPGHRRRRRTPTNDPEHERRRHPRDRRLQRRDREPDRQDTEPDRAHRAVRTSGGDDTDAVELASTRRRASSVRPLGAVQQLVQLPDLIQPGVLVRVRLELATSASSPGAGLHEQRRSEDHQRQVGHAPRPSDRRQPAPDLVDRIPRHRHRRAQTYEQLPLRIVVGPVGRIRCRVLAAHLISLAFASPEHAAAWPPVPLPQDGRVGAGPELVRSQAERPCPTL